MLKLNLIHTVAFSGIVLFIGYGLRRLIRPLERVNIPAPVVGGLLVACLTLVARRFDLTLFEFDTTLRDPLMIAFFTTIGFGASISFLKKGGRQVLIFFGVATVFAVLQNVLGILIALPFGLHPLFGLLAGSVTLTGGPATGLAFAPLFEKAGVSGAATVAIAAAMFGIVSGGLLGGPIGTLLIERHKLKKARSKERELEAAVAENIVEEKMGERTVQAPADEDREAYLLLQNLAIIMAAMWVGSWLSSLFTRIGFTLPAYIGAMLIAALIRNFDDLTGWLRLSQRTIDDIGHVALQLFLVIALMTLKLWELAGLVLPLVVILLGQIVLIAVACLWPVYRLMGRNYESAVMSSGFFGFMMGTTANAMASMKTIVERYGRSRHAFLVVSMVGAFFIDFTNAVIITIFMNVLK
ncbi:MAG: gltS [Candidatus Aminicenantes bacterium]|nr:gltS [Candidatus Aminicenantes bacterium]